MKPARALITILPLVVACSDDGSNGKNGLVATATESAGDNCENGGLKVTTGLDQNGNGTLDESEVTETNYVCSGAAGADGSDGSDGTGAGEITTEVTAATAEECPSGGQKVTFLGPDGGPTGEPAVICGSNIAQAFGNQPYARAFRTYAAGPVLAVRGQTDPIVLSASISVPSRGYIIARASAALYCTEPPATGVEAYGVCAAGAGNTLAFLTIVDHASTGQDGRSGESTLLSGIPENRTTSINAGAVFQVSPGQYTYDMLGRADDFSSGAGTTSVSYTVPELTLVFVPSA